MTIPLNKTLALALLWILTIPVSIAQTPAQDFINSSTDNLIIPALKTAASDALTLQQQSQEFCKKPDTANLTELQQKWKKAMHSWSALGLFRFGPMIDNNIDLKIHYLPIRKTQIKANVLTLPEVSNQLPVSARGLASLEYLVFDPERTISEITSIFDHSQNQCRYLEMLTDQLHLDLQHLLKAWRHKFAPMFKGADQGITTHEALSQIITSTIRYFEYSIKNRLSRPAGIHQSNPQPYKVESWRSGESINNLLAGINSFEALLAANTADNTGLASLLSQKGQAALAETLRQQTTKLKASLMAIEPSLFVAVTQSIQPIESVIHNYQQLTEDIKTDVATLLDIQIGFNDDDGD